uniref:Uncharacterized protein n=1 Tax=Arundo donax TaxID=35708 RepID=A0A0A9EIE8_ARUDO
MTLERSVFHSSSSIS